MERLDRWVWRWVERLGQGISMSSCGIGRILDDLEVCLRSSLEALSEDMRRESVEQCLCVD